MGKRKRDRKSVAVASANADGSREPSRFSVRRKTETALRLLRGEPLDGVACELGVTAATLAQWREQFLAGGQAYGQWLSGSLMSASLFQPAAWALSSCPCCHDSG